MARQSRAPRVVRQKRLNSWIGNNLIVETTVASNAILLAALSNAELLEETPYTVVRTRGVLTVWSDQAGVSEAPQGIFGMIIVTDTAAQLGSTAVPDPLNDFADDWYVYQPFQQPASRQVGGSGSFNEIGVTQYIIDSKAMRKVDRNENQVIVIRNSSATDGLIFTYIGRQLIKLH